MWPFRRARATSPVGAAPVVRSSRGEWASLPTIQRVVEPMPPTFGTASFEAGLPSRHGPQFLQRLGHDVSATAPGGLVSGLVGPARPEPSPGTGALALSRSSPAIGTRSFGPPPWRAGSGLPEVEGAPTGSRVARLAESTAGSLTWATPPAALPTLQLTPVLSQGATTPGTDASPLGDTLPSVQPPPTPVVHDPEPVASSTEPQRERSTDLGPLVGESSLLSDPPPVPGTPVVPDAPAVPDPPAGTAATTAELFGVSSPATQDHVRRLGLGAPLPFSRPGVDAPIQRSVDPPVQRSVHFEPDAPVEATPRPLLPERPLLDVGGGTAEPGGLHKAEGHGPGAGPDPRGSENPAGPDRSEEVANKLSLAVDRLAPETPNDVRLALDRPLPVHVASHPTPSPAPDRPILGGRPSPLLSTQRTTEPARPSPPAPARRGRTGPDIPGTPVQRSRGRGPVVEPPEVIAASAGSGVQLTAYHPALHVSSEGAGLPVGALGSMGQGRGLVAMGPMSTYGDASPRTPAGPRVAPPAVQRLSLPLPSRPDVPQLPQASQAQESASGLPSLPAVPEGMPSGLPAGGVPGLGELGQSAVGAATGAAGGITGAATGAVEAATGAVGAAVGAAMPSEQLEELAKGLYDKIRDRLKAELRLDRERWGRVTDLAR
jgi:hypothetical protein